MTQHIGIPAWEWRNAHDLASIAAPDVRDPNGRLRLRSDGTRRRWYAGDAFRQVEIDGGTESAVYDIGIPASLVRFAATVCADAPEAVLVLSGSGSTATMQVSSVSGTMTIEDSGHPGAGLQPIDAACEFPTAAFACSSAGTLLELVHVAATRCVAELDALHGAVAIDAPCLLGIGNGALTIVVDRADCGHSECRIQTPFSNGTAVAQVNPSHLASLLALFPADEQVAVSLMSRGPHTLVLDGAGIRASIIAHLSAAEQGRRRVEGVIRQACGTLAAQRDAGGDYLLRRRNVPILGRLTDDDMPLMQVFSVVIDGIDASPELFTELNDLNGDIAFARLFHRDGQVLAGVDMMAESLEPDDLLVAVLRIEEVARTIIPLLSTVFGGNVSPDPVASRLEQYRSVVVEAEVTPGVLTTLNGTDACHEWPFPGPVHSITVCNPQGVAMDDAYYEAVTLRLAEDILRSGGRFVHGRGSSPSRSQPEQHLIAWGLTRDEARRMGQRANQDAIFEIDQSSVRLVSCSDDSVQTWDRMPSVTV